MPKQSERAKLMRELEERLAIEGYHLTTRQLTGQVSTVDDDYFDALRYLYAAVESTRYLSERNYISRPLQYENVMSQTNDRDFKEWYRLTKSQFGRLLAAIQDHSAFQSKGVNQQTHPGNQLLVTLVRIPFFGTGASYSCTRMKVNTCIGSIRNYEKRVVKAILAMRDATICWPDERERQEIAFRIQLQYGFPNCVGFTDGCLFNLAEKPLSFGEDYFHRKSGYGINSMIFCDDNRRIRYFLAGFPGSSHDQRLLDDTKVFQNTTEHFASDEYVLGDSAFTPHVHLIPCFKKLPFLPLEYRKEKFNEKIAKPRIISEHTNGILKGRWGILKQIPHVVKDKRSMNHVLKLITVCVILHNLLLDSVDGTWLGTALDEGDDNDGDDIDGNLPVEPSPQQIHCSDIAGVRRREEMVSYFEEAGFI